MTDFTYSGADPADYVAVDAEYQRLADPQKFFEYKNPKQRELVQWVNRGYQVYSHWANWAGKTTIGAHLSVAFMRGLDHLAGEPIPKLKMPASGILVIKSFKQSTDSSVLALRQAIGLHDKHEAKVSSGLDYVGVIYVRPDGWRSDDFGTWSKITLFPHDGVLPEGLRIDFAWPDETPPHEMLQEVRFRKKAGQPYPIFITATPTDALLWKPLMEEGEFRDCLGEPKGKKIRIQSSVYENSALTPEDIADAEAAASSDANPQARLFGDHIDDAGENPFKQQWAEILRLETMVRDPKIKRIRVTCEDLGAVEGRLVLAELQIEIFEPWDPNEIYIVPGDPSLGVPGGKHDPCGAHVWACRAPRLVARYNGFSGAYGLGTLLGYLGESYGDAWAWPLVTGGHGGPTLTALAAYRSEKHPHGYANVGRDRNVVRPGQEQGALGITESEINKAEAIEALRQALASRRIGMPSAKVLQRYKEAVMDERGRLVKTFPGQYEDTILSGFALHIIEDHPPSEPARRYQTSAADKFLQHFGAHPRRNSGSVISGARWKR